jgi:hypothetical protein
MPRRAARTLTVVAGVAWLVVAGYGVRSAVVDEGSDWEPTYMVFSLALLIGAAASVRIAMLASRQSARPGLRMVGLAVSGLGGAGALVAWALPLWMTVLGVGFAMVAVASEPRQRRAVALLAAGQLIGLAILFAGIAAEVGRRDEWGDYPAAGGLALVVVAAITVSAVFGLAKSNGRPGEMQGDTALTFAVGDVSDRPCRRGAAAEHSQPTGA